MSDHYIALDPGGTSGVAIYRNGEFNSMELAYPFWEQSLLIHSFLIDPSLDKVIYEKYTITQHTAKLSQQPEALMLIGVIEFLAHDKCVPQMPSAAKSFCPDAALKAVGWWNPTVGGHANDASRHLLLSAVRDHWLPTELMTKFADWAISNDND